MNNGNIKELTRFESRLHYEHSSQQPQNNKLMSKVLGTTFLIHIFKTKKTKVSNPYNIPSLSYPLWTPSFNSTINSSANFVVAKRPSVTQSQELDSPAIFEHYSHKAHHKLLRHHYLHQTNTHTHISKKIEKSINYTLFYHLMHFNCTNPFSSIRFFLHTGFRSTPFHPTMTNCDNNTHTKFRWTYFYNLETFILKQL